MTGVSNNATKNILGFDYQKFIALERCLNSKDNEVIWIECFGDVAHNGTSTEIKHHISETFLYDTHRDFWKTLYNLIIEEDVYSDFTRFELLTTSKIKEGSIFFEWNNLSKEQKVKNIRSVTPNDTINKYYQVIMSKNDNILSGFVGKLSIISSQPNIEEKLQDLKSHKALFFIPDIHKETFIEKMLGYISLKAIRNMNMWHVEFNEFKREMIGFSMPYVKKDYPFPLTMKSEVTQNSSVVYYFVDELTYINIGEKMVTDAIMDYLRSERSLLKIIKLHSSLTEHLEEFDENLLQDLGLLKLKHSINLQLPNFENSGALKQSQLMYSDSLMLQLKQIRNIQPIEGYYQKGRVHSYVEQKRFSWIFEVK